MVAAFTCALRSSARPSCIWFLFFPRCKRGISRGAKCKKGVCFLFLHGIFFFKKCGGGTMASILSFDVLLHVHGHGHAHVLFSFSFLHLCIFPQFEIREVDSPYQNMSSSKLVIWLDFRCDCFLFASCCHVYTHPQNGMTALDWAKGEGRTEVVALLARWERFYRTVGCELVCFNDRYISLLLLLMSSSILLLA